MFAITLTIVYVVFELINKMIIPFRARKLTHKVPMLLSFEIYNMEKFQVVERMAFDERMKIVMSIK